MKLYQKQNWVYLMLYFFEICIKINLIQHLKMMNNIKVI
jgi:hypothetical protein